MDSSIKYIVFLSILVSSCSISDQRLSFKKDNLNINSAVTELEFASSFITIGKSNEIFAVLSSKNKKTFQWVTSKDHVLNFKNGKLVRSSGLNHDFYISEYNGFNKKLKDESLIRFTNPDSGYMKIYFNYKVVKTGMMKRPISKRDFPYKLIEESFTVPLIKWSGKNYYWIDDEGITWLSKQEVSPFNEKIRFKLIKKHSS